jgi:hypothetical protein
MTDTTNVNWDVDGTSLNTYAWNIATLGGTRDSVPPWRGTDRKYAYRPGAAPRLMMPDSRTVTLAMWVIGQHADGSVAENLRRTFTSNRRMLKRLFWQPDGTLFGLTKRWVEDDGGGVQWATGFGRVVSDMAPEMNGPYRGMFNVDVFMPDPFFYGAQENTTIERGETRTVGNQGDDRCRRVSISFVGPLTNPRITNLSGSGTDVWVELGMSISAGVHVTVDVDDATVTRELDGANLIGALSHHGDHAWMRLYRGGNDLQLTASSGSGNAVVKMNPAYL